MKKKKRVKIKSELVILGENKRNNVSFPQERLQELKEHVSRLQDTLDYEKAKVSE